MLHRLTGPASNGHWYFFDKQIRRWDINNIKQKNWQKFFRSRNAVEAAEILLELDRLGQISIDRVTKQNWRLMLFS